MMTQSELTYIPPLKRGGGEWSSQFVVIVKGARTKSFQNKLLVRVQIRNWRLLEVRPISGASGHELTGLVHMLRYISIYDQWKRFVCDSTSCGGLIPTDESVCTVPKIQPTLTIQCDNPRRFYNPLKWDSTVILQPIDREGSAVVPRSEYQTFVQNFSKMVYVAKGWQCNDHWE